jgi:undecaprenyl-diphosphatase
VSKDQFLLTFQWVVDREVDVCGLFNRMSRRRILKSFFVSISRLGDGGAWYALILALPLFYGQSGFSTSFDMFKVGVINLVLYKIIKQLAGRPRPCAVNPEITVGTVPLDQYSFPSGHTMHAAAFAIIATAHHPELAVVLVPLSSVIALSRIVLGLHYPTDVIAGGILGGFVASTLMTG